MSTLFSAESLTVILATASAVVLLCNAAEKVIRAVRFAKKPNDRQNERLDVLEEWKESVDRKLHHDDDRIGEIQKGERATQRAILALLDHGIDGNNIKQMQHAKEELQNHLINR